MRRRMQDMGSPYGGSNPYDEGEGEVNPLAYLTNLADCMLILACGFMVALITAWNVDLSGIMEVEKTESMVEIDDVEELEEQLLSGGDSYTELGKVYEDPETGALYMVERDADAASESASDQPEEDGVPEPAE